MAVSETFAILAGRTAVLSIAFGIRLATRVVAGGGAAAPRSDGGEGSAADGSGGLTSPASPVCNVQATPREASGAAD
jgi:hypothetical protein